MTQKAQLTDYLILLVVLLLGMWQLVLGISVMKWDAMDIYLPWKHFTAEAISNGTLPLWNPFMNTGFAQMGDPNTWYPLSWVIALVSKYNIYAVQFEYLLHLYLAGIGFYKVAQLHSMSRPTRLIVATAYMLCGFFISNAQHTGWIISAAWFPFIYFYFIRLRSQFDIIDGLKLGFCFFMMFSGGYPGIFISTFYLLLLFFCYFLFLYIKTKNIVSLKKWIIGLSVSAIVFFLLSAVAIISALDLSNHITRGAGLAFDNSHWGVLTGSLPVKALITFISPYAGSVGDQKFWGEDSSVINCYMGLIPLLFIVYVNFQRNTPLKIRLFSLLGILFLLTAFAHVVPIRKWLYMYLPLMDLFRFSALFRMFAIFFFLLAAGYGLELLIKNLQSPKRFIRFFVGAFAILGLVQLFLFLHIEKWPFKQLILEGLSSFDKVAGIKEKIFLQCGIQMGILALIVILCKYRPKYFIGLIVFISCTDMVLATQLNIYATVVQKSPAKEINQAFSNFPNDYPLPSLSLPMSKTNDDAYRGTIPYLWQNLAIYYKIPSCSGSSPYSFYTDQKARANGTFDAVINNPLLFLAPLVNKNGMVDTGSIDKKSFEKITITSFNPNHINLKVTTSEPQSLVLLQNYYPHWIARVNGREQPVVKTNDTFMSVSVPKGVNEVIFEFKPTKVIYAFYVSYGCLIFFLAFVISLTVRGFLKSKNYYQLAAVGILGFILAALTATNLYGRHSNQQLYNNLDKITATLKSNPSNTLSIYNTDKSAEIKTDAAIVNIQINRRNDLSALVAVLDSCKKDHLFYAQVNKMILPDTREIITDYYPNILFEENFGNSYIIHASRGKTNQCPYKLLFFNDFEKEHGEWSNTSKLHDSIESYSGRMSLKLDSANVYSPAYSKKFSEISTSKKILLRVSLYTKFEANAEPILVISTRRDTKNITWHGEKLTQYCLNPKVWGKAYSIKELGPEIEPGDFVEIYIWNNSKKTVWIDDFKIEACDR